VTYSRPSGSGMKVTVDGVVVQFRAGQTVAAVLIEERRQGWRRTRRRGQWRGLSCGIGVCFDCLVTLNGTPGVRACLVDARDGDEIITEEGSGFAGAAV
jgi:aerobic-type carbon monoxide dehydrogenase small subunit (CoxS/CutS family)